MGSGYDQIASGATRSPTRTDQYCASPLWGQVVVLEEGSSRSRLRSSSGKYKTGRCPVSCSICTRRLSRTVSPASRARTRYGTGSQKSSAPGGLISTLKRPAGFLPNGPRPTVSDIRTRYPAPEGETRRWHAVVRRDCETLAGGRARAPRLEAPRVRALRRGSCRLRPGNRLAALARRARRAFPRPPPVAGPSGEPRGVRRALVLRLRPSAASARRRPAGGRRATRDRIERRGVGPLPTLRYSPVRAGRRRADTGALLARGLRRRHLPAVRRHDGRG